MFGGIGLTQLLVVLAIVLLVFGPKRLKSLGADLGSAIKGFRKAVSDDEVKPHQQDESRLIEGEPLKGATASKVETKHDTNV